jgi:hypothetical protein
MPYWPRDRYLDLAPAYWQQTRARLVLAEIEAELGFITVAPILAETAEQALRRPASFSALLRRVLSRIGSRCWPYPTNPSDGNCWRFR